MMCRRSEKQWTSRFDVSSVSRADLRITEPIAMELLAGVDTPLRETQISVLVDGLRPCPSNPHSTTEQRPKFMSPPDELGDRFIV